MSIIIYKPQNSLYGLKAGVANEWNECSSQLEQIQQWRNTEKMFIYRKTGKIIFA